MQAPVFFSPHTSTIFNFIPGEKKNDRSHAELSKVPLSHHIFFLVPIALFSAPTDNFTLFAHGNVFIKDRAEFNGSDDFYVVFDPTVAGLDAELREGYTYDEDINSYYGTGNDDSWRDLAGNNNGKIERLNPFTDKVTRIAMAVADGIDNDYDAGVELRKFTNKYVFGCWSGGTSLHYQYE